MWQQCPNCKGSGTTFCPLSHSTSAVCTVCKGHKIISELTGLPPISEPVKVVSKNTQDADFDIEKQASIISLANEMRYIDGELVKIGDVFTDGSSGREDVRLKNRAKVLYVDKFILVWFPLNDFATHTDFEKEKYRSRTWCLSAEPKK